MSWQPPWTTSHLRHLVLGLRPVPAAALRAPWRASADLMEDWGIPQMTIAAGADGLLLTKEIIDPE